jgi:hypothetical protein
VGRAKPLSQVLGGIVQAILLNWRLLDDTARGNVNRHEAAGYIRISRSLVGFFGRIGRMRLLWIEPGLTQRKADPGSPGKRADFPVHCPGSPIGVPACNSAPMSVLSSGCGMVGCS